jgi:hypothetical protein
MWADRAMFTVFRMLSATFALLLTLFAMAESVHKMLRKACIEITGFSYIHAVVFEVDSSVYRDPASRDSFSFSVCVDDFVQPLMYHDLR